jgi:signal transduction histidine kinase
MPQSPTVPIAVFDLLELDLGQLTRDFGIVLFCHLMIERALEELLARAGEQLGEDWRAEFADLKFHRKVGACEARMIQVGGHLRPIISRELAAALRTLNDLRNRISHEYKTPLTFEDVHAYVAALEAAGVDFTDHFATSPQAARGLGYEGIFGLMHEATKHLFSELGFILDEAGGDNLIA